MIDLEKLLVTPSSSLYEVMSCINKNAKGIALVVDRQRRLLGTITDGDIRRAILAGMSLEEASHNLLKNSLPAPHPMPLTAEMGTSDVELFRLMNEYTLHHIPLVDATGRVVDVALLRDLIKDYELPLAAVIMAGGYGTRLRPLTETVPKPMLPVGDRPLLELIIEQLRQSGIRQIHLATHYKGEVIARHFGDGRNFGVRIRYVQEKQPLGTAGALGLLDASDEALLVMNGDILTQVDFHTMLDFHRQHRADMTVAVRSYEVRLPYGVIHTQGDDVVSITEKPTMQHFINAGIYLLNPTVCNLIPTGQPYDMTELIEHLLDDGHRVVSFPISNYWQDIGHVDDYQKAITAVTTGEFF
jgi:dTDP-glucose pyrophosphorylase/CBS domain-containing protein